MFANFALLLISIGILPLINALNCTVTEQDGRVDTRFSDDYNVCARYIHVCADNDRIHNALCQNRHSGERIKVYTGAWTCDPFLAAPTAYENLECCSTDLCTTID